MSAPITIARPSMTPPSSYLTMRANIAAENQYVPLTPEGLILFCQTRLSEMDTQIQLKMRGQQNLVALQGEITSLQSDMKTYLDGSDSGEAFNDPEKLNALDARLSSLIATAEACGQTKLADTLKAVKAKLHTAQDNIVSKTEITDMCDMLTSGLSVCSSGAEISMIELQATVSRRATQLQMTTSLIATLNEAPKAIAGNMRA